MAPRSATAMTAMALGMPLAMRVVPSTGSTATSHSGPLPSPTCSPLNSIGAWSFSPSPMTTTPFMLTVPISARIASTAAPSPPFLSPRPTQRPAATPAPPGTRTSSRARLRSGAGRSARKPAPTVEGRESGSDTGPPGSTTGSWDPMCMPTGPTDQQQPPGSEDAAAAPPPPADRRGRQTFANMLRSLAPLVVIVVAVVWWTSFRQSPDVEPVKAIDPSSTLQLAANRAGYQLLVPTGLPDGYSPTSARTDAGGAEA